MSIKTPITLKSVDEVHYIFKDKLFKYFNVTKEPLFYICGGALRDTFVNEPFNDVDLYTTGIIQEHMVHSFLSTEGTLLTEKDHVYNYKFNDLNIQLIKHKFSSQQIKKYEEWLIGKGHGVNSDNTLNICKILMTFDFKVNSMALGDNGDFWSINETQSFPFLNGNTECDLKFKNLHINPFSYEKPLNIIKRAMKFSKRGYDISTATVNHLLFQVNKMDLGDCNPETRFMCSYYDEFVIGKEE
jgi:hypothetical protein